MFRTDNGRKQNHLFFSLILLAIKPFINITYTLFALQIICLINIFAAVGSQNLANM